MTMRALVLAAALGITAAVLAAPAQVLPRAGVAPLRRADLFGVVTHYWGDAIPTRMRELGATWARVHCSWADVQPTASPDPTTWNWSCPDQAMSAATQGFRVLYGLGYAPSWANGGRDGIYPPTGEFVGAWTYYCAELMRRYRNLGVVYEVWNEPNLDVFFMGTLDDYVNLVRGASQAVRAVDPSGRIAGPETSDLNSPGRETWHNDAVSRLGSMLDVVTSHWYCGARCAGGPEVVAQQLADYVRQRTSNVPGGTPFWLTETGLGTPDDAAQAAFYDGVLTAYQRGLSGPSRRMPTWQNVFFYHLLAPDDATMVRMDQPRTPREAFRLYQTVIRGTAVAVPRR